jgi:hypothetical protein
MVPVSKAPPGSDPWATIPGRDPWATSDGLASSPGTSAHGSRQGMSDDDDDRAKEPMIPFQLLKRKNAKKQEARQVGCF